MQNFIRKKSLFTTCQSYCRGSFSFVCLNIAQFLGALNDNIYKPLTIFFLLSVLGQEKSGTIVSMVGILYVLPFLLFSSMGGILADRFSKQKLIQILKGIEILFLALALWAFSTKSPTGCYLLLFLVATHSAIFGPSKYGILPELVETSQLPKANGAVTGCTYLAIIIGTFLASFFTDISHGNFLIGVSFCIFFSIIGLIAAFGIRKTPPQKSAKKITPFFVREIFQTLQECRKYPLLIPCLIGSAYFLFIGAFTQLNIIPLAMESLHLSAYAGGYLFLCTAIGIALGSYLCGKMLKKRPSLGLSTCSGFIIGCLFAVLALFSFSAILVSLTLALLGIFGGIFILSFDTFIQIHSPTGKRGQTIATANFLSFLGVFIAAAFLYVSSNILHFSAKASFMCVGIVTLLTSCLLYFLMLEVTFPFFARHFPLYKAVQIEDPLGSLKHGSLFVVERSERGLPWIIYGHKPLCQLIFLQEKKSLYDFCLSLSQSVLFLPIDTPLEEVLKQAKSWKAEDSTVCIICDFPLDIPLHKTSFSFFPFKEKKVYTAHFRSCHTTVTTAVFEEF